MRINSGEQSAIGITTNASTSMYSTDDAPRRRGADALVDRPGCHCNLAEDVPLRFMPSFA